MNKKMICKNCKYHYIEDISFDYPQSCCSKRKAVIEAWFNCDEFEYSEDYINNLKKQINKQKEVIEKAKKYLTSYESIHLIQYGKELEVLCKYGCNQNLDNKTILEMTNRYLKVHDKLLDILKEISK